MTASDRSTRPGLIAEHRRRKASPSVAIATVAHAFDEGQSRGVRLNAFWASDAGHCDFQDLVFTNPYRFHTDANPAFFRGTAVEAKLAQRRAA